MIDMESTTMMNGKPVTQSDMHLDSDKEKEFQKIELKKGM